MKILFESLLLGGVNILTNVFARRKTSFYLRYNRWFFKKQGVVYGNNFQCI